VRQRGIATDPGVEENREMGVYRVEKEKRGLAAEFPS